MNLNFRTLKASEIDARVAQVKPNGITLLLYKDARCDMNILDETVGPMNWKREHTRDNANCIISVYDEDKKEWVGKEDTGTESYAEAQKGLASDSFKRAAVNWGIGRELYTAPFIWIPADKANIQGGKCYEKFEVFKVEYDENKNIIALEIINSKSKEVVYKKGQKITGESKPQVQPKNIVEKKEIKEDNIKILLESLIRQADLDTETVFEGFSKQKEREITINNMTEEDFKELSNLLKNKIKKNREIEKNKNNK